MNVHARIFLLCTLFSAGGAWGMEKTSSLDDIDDDAPSSSCDVHKERSWSDASGDWANDKMVLFYADQFKRGRESGDVFSALGITISTPANDVDKLIRNLKLLAEQHRRKTGRTGNEKVGLAMASIEGDLEWVEGEYNNIRKIMDACDTHGGRSGVIKYLAKNGKQYFKDAEKRQIDKAWSRFDLKTIIVANTVRSAKDTLKKLAFNDLSYMVDFALYSAVVGFLQTKVGYTTYNFFTFNNETTKELMRAHQQLDLGIAQMHEVISSKKVKLMDLKTRRNNLEAKKILGELHDREEQRKSKVTAEIIEGYNALELSESPSASSLEVVKSVAPSGANEVCDFSDQTGKLDSQAQLIEDNDDVCA